MHVLSFRSGDMHQEAGNRKTAQHQAVRFSGEIWFQDFGPDTSGIYSRGTLACLPARLPDSNYFGITPDATYYYLYS
jgi:hypothetical protein